MNWKVIAVVILFMGSSLIGTAQKTSVYSDINLSYKKGVELYQQGLFGAAQNEFKKVMNTDRMPNQHDLEILKTQAEFKYAQCAVRLNHPDGEKMIVDFIRSHSPGAVANKARMEMGNYYYNAGKYDEAIAYYEDISTLDLSNESITELKFKIGYCYFVRKKFKKAKGAFKQVKEIKGPYYYHSNYYYGITEFFENNYKAALASFAKVKKSKKYSQVVPYYITQIHFAEKQFDQVIKYGNSVIKDRRLKYKSEINHLIGQAYFERKDYKKALPYMEEYAKTSRRMREEDFYQVGFTQYKTGRYAQAIENFKGLSGVNNKLGQNALYNLGDCYLKTDNKVSARNAYKKAMEMNFDPVVKEESEFAYAKLSYELKDDKEAVRVLQMIKRNTSYYNEAQKLLSQVFINTRNYSEAISILETMPGKTKQLKEAYQKVTYFQGIQMYNDGNKGEAKRMFQKSLQYSNDLKTRALTYYWMAELSYEENKFDASIKDYGKFLTAAKSIPDMPATSSLHTANYATGYAYLKKNDYNTGRGYFEKAVSGIENNRGTINNQYVTGQILPDAILRVGDCYFKYNKYTKAQEYYNKVIRGNYNGQDYAVYQKAIILGLKGKEVDKIVALEDLIKRYDGKGSKYIDDAYLALGTSYLELGKFNEAEDALKNLTRPKYKTSPLRNRAYIKLGLIAFNMEENEKALAYYKNVFPNNPTPKEKIDALRGIEEIYVDMGNPEGYFAFVETIGGVQISNIAKDSIQYKAAENLFFNGDYERAAKSFSKYLRSFKNGTHVLPAHYQRGECFYITKKYDAALKDYEALIQRGQSRYYERATKKAALIAYNHSQDFSKAFDYYQKYEAVATTDEDKFEAQLGAVRSAYRGGNARGVYEIADRVTRNSKAQKKDKGEAQFYMGKMALSESAKLQNVNDPDKKKLHNKAKGAFNEVIRNMDNVMAAESRYQIAYIYYIERDLETAQELALNTYQEIPNYEYWLAKSVVLLGDIFTEKGDFFNAKASLQSIVDNYTGDQALITEAKQKLKKIEEMEGSNSRLNKTPTDSGTLELDAPLEGEDN